MAPYKLGTSSPTDIRFFKEAITHNFQATVNAIKLADKNLMIYPHDKNIEGIRTLLIDALKLAESRESREQNQTSIPIIKNTEDVRNK